MYFQVLSLRDALDEMWENGNGSVILFIWINFLQNDILESLDVTSPLLVNADTLASILDNDKMMLRKVYLLMLEIIASGMVVVIPHHFQVLQANKVEQWKADDKMSSLGNLARSSPICGTNRNWQHSA